MKIKLPVQLKEIKDGKLKKEVLEKEFDLDTSVASQVRFEAKFPELAENEDLYEYSKRISVVKSKSAGVIISQMKVLYCYLDTDMSYMEFLKMFDLADLEYIKKLTSAITECFDIVFNSSAEKN